MIDKIKSSFKAVFSNRGVIAGIFAVLGAFGATISTDIQVAVTNLLTILAASL